MNYPNFDLTDFILDDYFQEWVCNPTSDVDQFWEDWIRQHPEKSTTVYQARAIIRSLNFEGTDPNKFSKEKVWQNIRAIIKTDELKEELNISQENEVVWEDTKVRETITHSLPARQFQKKKRYSVLVAATVSLIVLLGVWQLFVNNPAAEYTTDFGETAKVVLPDGSSVVLNANSRIRYYYCWGGQSFGKREVELSGEAFFSVVPTEDNQKFIVRSHGVSVEVIGTEFNVNNRRDKTQVVLRSGKVVLNMPNSGGAKAEDRVLNMEPGDLVEVSEQDQEITKKIVNPAKYAAWTQEVLVFDNTPLSNVFEVIRDTYGYDVTVMDSGVEDMVWEAEISSRNIDLILKILSKSFNLEITKRGNKLIVKKK